MIVKQLYELVIFACQNQNPQDSWFTSSVAH